MPTDDQRNLSALPLDALGEAAEIAHGIDPGPWYFDGRDIFTRSKIGAAAHHLILPIPETFHESQRVPDAIARHIAACDPGTILALLDEVERLRDELEKRRRGDDPYAFERATYG